MLDGITILSPGRRSSLFPEISIMSSPEMMTLTSSNGWLWFLINDLGGRSSSQGFSPSDSKEERICFLVGRRGACQRNTSIFLAL